MKKLIIAAVLILGFHHISAQEEDTLTIKEVVVTGQYSSQSIKKSLYKVEVLTSVDLKRMAANNVAEALTQMHNLLIVPEKNSGDSKANILGLRSDYTKILIDNIPVIGDTGLGSNIDLTKVGIDNIERIEVVKGSMGVEFGNNAMAGVINIITKKSSKKPWNVRGFVQEETVGKEYDWIDYGKGRHIQNINISHTFGGGKWYADLSLNRNDFQGYRGEKQGKNYFEQNNTRGYEWQPKEQWNPAYILRFSTPKTQIFYKGDYLLEEINYYSPLVNSKYLGGGERTFTGNDRDYFTDRILHHLNFSSQIFKKAKYTGDFSYQKQLRKYQDIVFDIPARARISETEKNTYYQAQTLYARNTLSNFINSEKINIQIGHEVDYTKGFAGAITAKFNDNNVKKDILNNAVFVSAEIPLTQSWFVRPGFRYNFSDTFNSMPNYSLVLKNQINDNSEFRAIIGSANRNPTFEELFTYFVDSNHNIQGNADLKPENSFSGTLFYSISNKNEEGLKWNLDFSTMFLQVKDRIEMAQVNATPLQFKYLNISNYQSWENAVSGKISNKNFGISAGYTILGKMPEMDNKAIDKYYYNHEGTLGLWYNLVKTGTSFATNLKYSGNNYLFFEDKSLGITQYILGKRKDFTLMDASVTQKIWKDYVSIALGVRNIFNVTSVQNIGGNTGAHNTTANQMLFYGRSYFGRLNFNF
ncbi:TonB-dependent receptor plug domain-containing protein [Cruoricaptor ignavus]|uniref:TonB-dependent receptor plug domain-containing protein n=1 Tax=Cruoricaptor ignavus TaxID=1118202 RepID=UPI00370D62DB